MAQFKIEKKRIIRFNLPRGYDAGKIEIGVPVVSDEAKKVKLKNIGDTVLPSALFGINSAKNANGYSYPDKTKPMENRYITTNWFQPYGNEHASPVSADIYRDCYPIIEVPPTEIEFTLHENSGSEKYVIAVLTSIVRKNLLKEVVNLFLEIYGFCYIFSNEIKIVQTAKRTRCNWEILPPGKKPSAYLKGQLKARGEDIDTFDVARLEMLDKYNVEQIAEEINGFNGYYAYIFSKHCVLESAKYGNATYIIPKENWEILSQRTKQELTDQKVVVEKIIHTENWSNTIRKSLQKLENQIQYGRF